MMTRNRCADRLASCGLLTGLILCCWLVGPAAQADGPGAQAPAKPGAATGPDQVQTTKPTSIPTTMPDVIDLGAATPKALLESMAKVLGEDAKPQAWLGFQPPANRQLVKEQFELASQLDAKAKKVAQLVAARIGNMEANMVKSFQGGVTAGGEITLRYQISQIAKNGKVDWDKVKITQDGDKAQAAIASTGETIPMAKVNDKWYLGEGQGQETLAKDAQGTKELTGQLMKVLDQLEQKVNSGQITKKNFIQQYQDLVNSTLALPKN
jgi:hypothetical protein